MTAPPEQAALTCGNTTREGHTMSGIKCTVTGTYAAVSISQGDGCAYARIICECNAERIVLVIPGKPPADFVCPGCGSTYTVSPEPTP